MEVIVIAVVAAVGLIWYFTQSNRKSVEAASEPEAPYKAETPTLTEMAAKAEVVEVAPVVEAVAPVVKAKAPAKPKSPAAKAKAPAKMAVKKPAARKPATGKKSA